MASQGSSAFSHIIKCQMLRVLGKTSQLCGSALELPIAAFQKALDKQRQDRPMIPDLKPSSHTHVCVVSLGHAVAVKVIL